MQIVIYHSGDCHHRQPPDGRTYLHIKVSRPVEVWIRIVFQSSFLKHQQIVVVFRMIPRKPSPLVTAGVTLHVTSLRAEHV